jgi:hypothetical protein
MHVHMTTSLPSEWATARPLETYETQFLSLGFSRYDTVKKMLSTFVRTPTGVITYTETPHTVGSLARCYGTESVTVTVYSRSPRVWVEDLGVEGQTVFVQHQPTHVA